jgi:hypothetical protein
VNSSVAHEWRRSCTRGCGTFALWQRPRKIRFARAAMVAPAGKNSDQDTGPQRPTPRSSRPSLAPAHRPQPRPRRRTRTHHRHQKPGCSAPTQPRPGVWARTLVRHPGRHASTAHRASCHLHHIDPHRVSTPQTTYIQCGQPHRRMCGSHSPPCVWMPAHNTTGIVRAKASVDFTVSRSHRFRHRGHRARRVLPATATVRYSVYQ